VARELLLAVDLGTTSVRTIALDPSRGIVARAQRPLPVAFPAPARVEQDPKKLWEHTLETLHEALRGTGRAASEVAALGVVSQRSTALAWDSVGGEPLAPAIGWQDQRTAPRVAELEERGISIPTLASATKFEWWLKRKGAVREAARAGTLRLGTPDAWLSFKLAGGSVHVTDPGQASCTGLYDLTDGDWSEPALALFGIEGGWLPRVVATNEPVAETPADLLGAPIPIAARAGDQQAATFAQGAHAPGDAKLTLGTSAILDVHAGVDVPPSPPGGYAVSLWRLGSDPEVFCTEGTVITAGALVDWLVALGLLPDASALDRVAGDVPDSAGVTLVPALQGLGAPYMDPGARGLIGGLTRGTRTAHLVRAAVDGLAQRCADLCDHLMPEDAPVRVDGGLGRSRILLETLADLSGRTLLRAAETETTALGAALLAGLGVGVFRDVPGALSFLGRATPFQGRLDEARRRAARAAWRTVVERCRSQY
jgi:glycerol kinase